MHTANRPMPPCKPQPQPMWFVLEPVAISIVNYGSEELQEVQKVTTVVVKLIRTKSLDLL